MPLQIGSAALSSLAKAAALLMPAGVLTLVALFVVVQQPDLGDASGWVVAIVFGPPFLLLSFAWKHLKRARAQRPSDLELQEQGFTVRGGPHHGTQVAFSEVTRCDVTTEKPFGDPDDSIELQRLKLVRAQGAPLYLAASDDAVELRSLAEVAATLLAAAQPAAPQLPDAPAEVLRCSQCQAPVPPSPEATAPCAFCGASNAMPEAVRQKLVAQAKVDRRDARAVAQLLRQPGAGFVGALYGVGAGFMLAAWPVGAGLLWFNVAKEQFTWLSALSLCLFVSACIAGFYTFLRGRLVDRQALRLLTLRFCARPLQKGFACRSCFAPLPKGPERTLQRCAYCDAPNVLAVDFSPQAQAVEDEARSLSEALERRNRERARWRFATGLGLVLIAAAAVGLEYGVGVNPLIAQWQPACERGSVSACTELGKLFSVASPTLVRPEPERAERLLGQACQQDYALACVALADLLAHPLGPIGRQSEALQHRERACALNLASACVSVGDLYRFGTPELSIAPMPETSLVRYQSACALRDAQGCAHLAEQYFNAQGTEENLVEAQRAWSKACRYGDTESCNEAGALLTRDEGGVPLDLEAARAFFNVACDGGVTLSCDSLKRLSKP